MVNKYEIKYLEWDTEYFGILSGRLNLYGQLSESELEKLKLQLKKYEFLTVYNYNNNDYNNFILRSIDNIFLSDVNVHLEKTIDKVSINDSIVQIKRNQEKDEKLLKIAESSFIHSRFLNDKNLNQERAKKIYYNWVNNSFNNPNKYFCIYEDKGFLLFSMDKEKNIATIELIAVKKEKSKKGIGSSLIKAFERYSYECGIKKLEVGTQLNNITAQKFYQRNGFTVTQYNSIYHIWNKK